MIESRQITNLSASKSLEEDLRRMILRNELKPDCAITPETELAKLYKISRNTARKALANLEAEGFLRKVQGRGTFVVPVEERPVDHTQLLKVTVAIDSYRGLQYVNAYDRNLISGCLEAGFLSGKELSFVASSALAPDDASIDSANFGGIIWERPDKNVFPVIEKLRDRNVPQVTISRSVPGVPSVFFDVDRSIQETVEFLASIGHRDIAFIDLGWDYPVFINRQRTFIDTLRRYGHKSPEKYLCIPPYGVNYLPYFDEIPHVTAIIAASFAVDDLYSWIESRGQRVPRDISLIALTSENASEFETHPDLSAILDPRCEIARTAMRILDDIIAGRAPSCAPRRICGELLIRKSCSSPATEKEFKKR